MLEQYPNLDKAAIDMQGASPHEAKPVASTIEGRFVTKPPERSIGADTSDEDGYAEFRAARQCDLHLICAGNERYEIPDAVVMGG